MYVERILTLLLGARFGHVFRSKRVAGMSLRPTIRVSSRLRAARGILHISMPDERSLQDTAREAIRTGRLPGQPPIRTLGGRGSGERCALCGEPIQDDQMEVELEFARRAGDTTEIQRYRFHPSCCVAWERAKLEATSD